MDGDGCSAACQVEAGYLCDVFAEPTQCRTVCGDGVAAGAEACDDGNTQRGDGCAPDCTPEPPEDVCLSDDLGESTNAAWEFETPVHPERGGSCGDPDASFTHTAVVWTAAETGRYWFALTDADPSPAGDHRVLAVREGEPGCGGGELACWSYAPGEAEPATAAELYLAGGQAVILSVGREDTSRDPQRALTIEQLAGCEDPDVLASPVGPTCP